MSTPSRPHVDFVTDDLDGFSRIGARKSLCLNANVIFIGLIGAASDDELAAWDTHEFGCDAPRWRCGSSRSARRCRPMPAIWRCWSASPPMTSRRSARSKGRATTCWRCGAISTGKGFDRPPTSRCWPRACPSVADAPRPLAAAPTRAAILGCLRRAGGAKARAGRSRPHPLLPATARRSPKARSRKGPSPSPAGACRCCCPRTPAATTPTRARSATPSSTRRSAAALDRIRDDRRAASSSSSTPATPAR
jgi:hypothetical protein